MKHFAQLINLLDQTNKTNEKVALLKEYYHSAAEEDKIWALALFTHRRPRRHVNTTLLRYWISEEAQIPHWLFEDSYHVVGDLAETVSLVLPDSGKCSDKTLNFWLVYLKSLEGMDEARKKDKILSALSALDKTEKFIFTKLITGSFRVGVSQNLIIRSIAEIYNEDTASIAYRITGNWDPYMTTFQDLLFHQDKNEDASKPFPFYLAYPLEENIDTLGEEKNWAAEWKWDGIRGQLIFRNEMVYVWTRGNELVTDKFPEFETLIGKFPDGTVIDGEIMPYKDGNILPFSMLQTRIGRKNLTKKILIDTPVSFFTFDILEWQKKDIRQLQFKERRNILERLFAEINSLKHIKLTDTIIFSSWHELAQIRQGSRQNRAEGLMIKNLLSPYEAGRKRGNWWKWKIEPYTIDGVLIYAQKGHGRRADLFSDYTFAVWDRDKLVPFAKAYSGLTDAEIKEVDTFVKRNTLERFGPVRTVRPELVFELAFEGINFSKRHKSGVALRFPRIKRWRKDKKTKDANTLEELKSLIHGL